MSSDKELICFHGINNHDEAVDLSVKKLNAQAICQNDIE